MEHRNIIPAIGGLGLLTMLFTMAVDFFQPKQLPIGHAPLYVTFMGLGLLIVVLIPLIIYHLKKPSWVIEKNRKNKVF
jgi:hypothetical protein